MASQSAPSASEERLVIFFDIDNCVCLFWRLYFEPLLTYPSPRQLYSRNFRIHNIMQDLIDDYFQHHLSLDRSSAVVLHQRYYKDYGLALDGLIRHHMIDALEYNKEVDDALPLEDILKPDPELRQLLAGIDKTKVKMWLFTNAYITHGRRVVKLLGVDDLFEGITYCDYASEDAKKGGLVCKPKVEMFERAMKEAGLDVGQGGVKERCFFVDDSAGNCRGGKEFGWSVAHFVEEELEVPASDGQLGITAVRSLKELKGLWPQLFKEEEKTTV